jgi:hypothetical protein
MSWNWREPAIRIPPKSDSPKHIVAVTDDNEPSPEQIALFCRTFRLMNGDQEPDPKGSLADVWSWLLTKANHGL